MPGRAGNERNQFARQAAATDAMDELRGKEPSSKFSHRRPGAGRDPWCRRCEIVPVGNSEYRGKMAPAFAEIA